MAEGSINIPGGFGGLMRYHEEYKSKLAFKPAHIIIFAVLIVIFVVVLKIFFPVSS